MSTTPNSNSKSDLNSTSNLNPSSSTPSTTTLPQIQRRSSTSLPGISATAESLRERKQRAEGSNSNSSASTSSSSTSTSSNPASSSTTLLPPPATLVNRSIRPSPLRLSKSEERLALLSHQEEDEEDEEDDDDEEDEDDDHHQDENDALRELSAGIIMPGMGPVGKGSNLVQSNGLGISRRNNTPLKLSNPRKTKSSSSSGSTGGRTNQPHQQIQLRQQINYAQQQLKQQQQRFSGNSGIKPITSAIGSSSSSSSSSSSPASSSNKNQNQKPQTGGYNYKGTPSRATRYSLPVRAEKPVRTSKTTGKHVVLPSESQLAPLPGQDDEEEDEEEEESESETDEDEDEEGQDSVPTKVESQSQVGEIPTSPSSKPSKFPPIKGNQRSKDKSHPALRIPKQPKSLITPSQSHARAPPRVPKSSGPAYHTFERLNPPSRTSTALPRLTSYALGTALHLPTLIGFLRREHGVKPRLYDECAYVVYFKPLLPGFGRANVRSAPEPRSGRSPGGESRRERMMEEQEDGGYDGGYFAAAPEEDEELDQDGYVKHERRNSSGDVKEGGQEESRGQDGEKTDTEATETETEMGRRRGSKDGESELEGTSDVDGDDESVRTKRNRRDSYNESEAEAEGPLENRPFTIDGEEQEEENKYLVDNSILSTPKAKPSSTESSLDADLDREIQSGLDIGVSNSETPTSLSPPSGSNLDQGFRDKRLSGKRRSVSETSSFSAEGDSRMSADDEPLNADRAGARDMLLQQDEEEAEKIDIQSGASLSEETAQDVMDAEARGDERDSSGGNIGPTSTNEAWRRESGQDEESEGPRTPGGTLRNRNPFDSPSKPQDGESSRKSRGRRVRKSRKSSGPNLASHNHDGSTNYLTSRSILEALQVAELIILPYGVLVMYNFSLSEERDILEDVISSGCVRGALKPDDEETEAFHFCYDPSVPAPRIFNDFFTFKSSNHLLKLSLAHAIAQSTKLSVFEESMQKTLELTSHIPKELASSGELALKRREALRLTGRLFKLRVDVNLTSNVLDTPELFWSEASLKALYDAIREYLEIDQRVENLNERLAVANDLLEIIHEHIANEAMSKITWVVISLIVVACVVACGEISARLVLHARGGDNAAARAATKMMANVAKGTSERAQMPWDI